MTIEINLNVYEAKIKLHLKRIHESSEGDIFILGLCCCTNFNEEANHSKV